jgi:hypothetical protein
MSRQTISNKQQLANLHDSVVRKMAKELNLPTEEAKELFKRCSTMARKSSDQMKNELRSCSKITRTSAYNACMERLQETKKALHAQDQACQKVVQNVDETIRGLFVHDAGNLLCNMMTEIPNMVYALASLYNHVVLHGTMRAATFIHVAFMAIFVYVQLFLEMPLMEFFMAISCGDWKRVFLKGGEMYMSDTLNNKGAAKRTLIVCAFSLCLSTAAVHGERTLKGVWNMVTSLFWRKPKDTATAEKNAISMESFFDMNMAFTVIWIVLRLYYTQYVATWMENQGANVHMGIFFMRSICMSIFNHNIWNWVRHGKRECMADIIAPLSWIVQYWLANYYNLMPIESIFINLFEMSTMKAAFWSLYAE